MVQNTSGLTVLLPHAEGASIEDVLVCCLPNMLCCYTHCVVLCTLVCYF